MVRRAAEQKIKEILADLATDPDVIGALAQIKATPEPESEREPCELRSIESSAVVAMAEANAKVNNIRSLGGPWGQSPLLLPRGVSFRPGAVTVADATDAAGQKVWDFAVPIGALPGHTLTLQLPDGTLVEWPVPADGSVMPGAQCRLPPLPPQAEMDAARAQAKQELSEASGGHSVGDVVQTWQGEQGTLRYIGELDGQKPGKIWLGVEWHVPGRGKNDGSVRAGTRYFTCAPGMGSFIDVRKKDKILDNRCALAPPPSPPPTMTEQRVLEILAQVATDPDVQAALASNTKIKAAFDDVTANPAGWMVYANDPDVAPLVMKMMAKIEVQQ